MASRDSANGANGSPPRKAKQGRPGARDLLRWALVNDDDPRFPWWLPLPGLALAASWAGFEGITGGGVAVFLSMLLWPGGGLFLLTTVAVFLGWQLDID